MAASFPQPGKNFPLPHCLLWWHRLASLCRRGGLKPRPYHACLHGSGLDKALKLFLGNAILKKCRVGTAQIFPSAAGFQPGLAQAKACGCILKTRYQAPAWERIILAQALLGHLG
jgi:hypothetical protein